MEIVRILAGIRAVGSGENNEFVNAFRNFRDVEYLEAFFEHHRQDLQSGFYGPISVAEAVLYTRDEAKRLEKLFLETSPEALFKPLDNRSSGLQTLEKSKAYGDRPKSWLRIYAIRVGNIYIVTGSAIKLTDQMSDRDHTAQELRKLDRCRSFLKDLGVFDEEGLEGYFETEQP